VIDAIEIARALGRPEPTPQQIAIIQAPLEPALVVAGAGSGKTETMANRVLWLLANDHVQPKEVLGLTFTRKAAGELAARVRLRIEQLVAKDLYAGEYDPSAARATAPSWGRRAPGSWPGRSRPGRTTNGCHRSRRISTR